MPTRICRSANKRLPRPLLEQWANVPASVAADAFAGRTLVDPALRPLRPFGEGKRLVGRAVTAFCEGADYGAVHHAIAVAREGDVIAIECGGRDNPAVIGELLGGAARLKGIAGVVVNGAVRDSGTLRRWQDFAVFARHITPRGPSSMEGGIVNDVISFAGARVAPGDIVLGDDDGLVIVPYEEAKAKIAAALARVAAELAWEKDLESGRSTLDVFKIPASVSMAKARR